jgi:hypothetical protein
MDAKTAEISSQPADTIQLSAMKNKNFGLETQAAVLPEVKYAQMSEEI